MHTYQAGCQGGDFVGSPPWQLKSTCNIVRICWHKATIVKDSLNRKYLDNFRCWDCAPYSWGSLLNLRAVVPFSSGSPPDLRAVATYSSCTLPDFKDVVLYSSDSLLDLRAVVPYSADRQSTGLERWDHILLSLSTGLEILATLPRESSGFEVCCPIILRKSTGRNICDPYPSNHLNNSSEKRLYVNEV